MKATLQWVKGRGHAPEASTTSRSWHSLRRQGSSKAESSREPQASGPAALARDDQKARRSCSRRSRGRGGSPTGGGGRNCS
eukprot:9604128-Alexandrium_andersonii.AAC.1